MNRPVAAAFVSGLLFAAGLAISGMTQPAKVVGFLDVSGSWDPSLALVMVGAIGVHAAARLWILKRATPLFGGAFPIYPTRPIDAGLLGGAAVFGIGWGLAGFCPGPALVSAFAGGRAALVFVPAMLAGMGLYRVVAARRTAELDETGATQSPACAS